MAVLITGGAGYIGSVAVEKTLAAGEEVVVLDNFSTGHRKALSPGAQLVEGSILDNEVLHGLFEQYDIDTVMHFAAFIVVPESCEDPAKYFENNVTGAHNLLQAMHRAGVGRFIFSSTAAVYGHPESVPVTEEAALQPLNPYGISKRMIEQMLEWYDIAYGMRYVAFRYFNAAGASAEHGEDHDPETHLIPNVMLAAEGVRDKVMIFGTDYPTPDGTCVRDYIHIEDLVSAHLLGMKHLRSGGDAAVLNLGNSVGISNLEVVKAVKKVTGTDFPVELGERRPGDSARLVASSEKARALLGWQPEKSDIENIVRSAWDWRQAHPKGYVS